MDVELLEKFKTGKYERNHIEFWYKVKSNLFYDGYFGVSL